MDKLKEIIEIYEFKEENPFSDEEADEIMKNSIMDLLEQE